MNSSAPGPSFAACRWQNSVCVAAHPRLGVDRMAARGLKPDGHGQQGHQRSGEDHGRQRRREVEGPPDGVAGAACRPIRPVSLRRGRPPSLTARALRRFPAQWRPAGQPVPQPRRPRRRPWSARSNARSAAADLARPCGAAGRQRQRAAEGQTGRRPPAAPTSAMLVPRAMMWRKGVEVPQDAVREDHEGVDRAVAAGREHAAPDARSARCDRPIMRRLQSELALGSTAPSSRSVGRRAHSTARQPALDHR